MRQLLLCGAARRAMGGMIVGSMGAAVVLVAAAGSAGAQDLTFSVMESGTMDVAAREIAEGFAAEHGVTVNVVAFPWAVLRQNNTTDLITGGGQYDVMSGGYYLADVYAYFAPLDAYIERDAYAEGMIAGLMEPGRSEWFEGAQIGVPFSIDSYGLLVNTEILDAAGVEGAMEDWQAVVDACATIAEALPDIACLSHPTGNPEQIGAFFFSAYDGTYINAEGAYELEADKAVAAASVLPGLWQYLPAGGAAMTFDESHQLFAEGGAAMLVTWPSFVSNMLDASEIAGKWEQRPLPGDGFPWLSLWQLFIPQTTEDKDAAWAWIQAYAGPEAARSNYVDHNIGSVWLSVYEDEALAADRAHHWPVMVGDFERAKNPPLSGEAQDFLTNTLQEIANGRQDAAAAIAAVNATWASIPVPSALAEAAAGSGLIAE